MPMRLGSSSYRKLQASIVYVAPGFVIPLRLRDSVQSSVFDLAPMMHCPRGERACFILSYYHHATAFDCLLSPVGSSVCAAATVVLPGRFRQRGGWKQLHDQGRGM